MQEAPVRQLSYAELDAGLAHIRQSPRDAGTLTLIVVRPTHGGRVICAEADVSPESGVAGDNWLERNPSPKVQITLMNARAAAHIAQSDARLPLAGDQLYADFDLSEDHVPAGTRLGIGAAEFVVTETPHNGCGKFATRFGADALRWVNSPEGKRLHLRGIYITCVRAGRIRPGDQIKRIQG
jgi:hypothetical protein